jgi:hypothetical protein
VPNYSKIVKFSEFLRIPELDLPKIRKIVKLIEKLTEYTLTGVEPCYTIIRGCTQQQRN